MNCNTYEEDTVAANPFLAPKAQDDQAPFSFTFHNLLLFLLLNVNAPKSSRLGHGRLFLCNTTPCTSSLPMNADKR